MKTLNKKDTFWVRCENPIELDLLMDVCEKEGYLWNTEAKPTEFNPYEEPEPDNKWYGEQIWIELKCGKLCFEFCELPAECTNEFNPVKWFTFREFYDNECPNFANDPDKMSDLVDLSKHDFLKSYSYLTEEEYDNTVNLIDTLPLFMTVKERLKFRIMFQMKQKHEADGMYHDLAIRVAKNPNYDPTVPVSERKELSHIVQVGNAQAQSMEDDVYETVEDLINNF